MTNHLPDTNVGNIEYIRKQDAVDALDELRVNSLDAEKGLLLLSGIAAASDIIESLKSAEVVPVVHAHWIQTSAEDENGNAYYSCSNCGRGESHNPIVEVPYCWKCGAKMDGEE